jgi:hypothetical protein
MLLVLVGRKAPIPTTIHPFLLAILTQSATHTRNLIHSQHPQHGLPNNPTNTIGAGRIKHRRAAILVQLTDFVEQGRRKADVYLP